MYLGDRVIKQIRRDNAVGLVDGMPRADSHYNLGTSHGPDKIGSRAGPGPRAVSCTWLTYQERPMAVFEELEALCYGYRARVSRAPHTAEHRVSLFLAVRVHSTWHDYKVMVTHTLQNIVSPSFTPYGYIQRGTTTK